MESTSVAVGGILHRLGVKTTSSVDNFLASHIPYNGNSRHIIHSKRHRSYTMGKSEELTAPKAKKLHYNYYGTHRRNNFNYLHWTWELDKNIRAHVEEHCRDVLLMLGYPIKYEQERNKRVSAESTNTSQWINSS